MSNAGFIKLPRKLREWTWYNNLNTRAVFLHILLGASWEDETVRGFKLRRGQFVTTVPELATENQLTIQQVKTALNHLKSTGDITVSVQSKISIITVNNYDRLLDRNLSNKELSTDTSNGYQPDYAQDNNRSTLFNNKTIIQEAEERAPAPADNISEEFVVNICESYNRICKSLPDIQPNIAVLHRARLIQAARQIMGDMSFEDLFAMIEKSDFLCGRSGNFKASFDWILRPENLGKILSGAYSQNYSKQENKKKMPTAADYHESLYDD